jgi:hypothetical protein
MFLKFSKICVLTSSVLTGTKTVSSSEVREAFHPGLYLSFNYSNFNCNFNSNTKILWNENNIYNFLLQGKA